MVCPSQTTPTPSCAVPCLQELGAAALSKRPTSCMLILPKPAKAGAGGGGDDAKEFEEAYGEVEKKVKAAEGS